MTIIKKVKTECPQFNRLRTKKLDSARKNQKTNTHNKGESKRESNYMH